MNTKSLVRLLSCLAFVFGMCSLSAAPVSAEQAKRAVGNWLKSDRRLGCPVRGQVTSVESHVLTNGASFHVAKLSGGGFVVTSADTGIEPVIAFSSAREFKADDRNPLWVMIRRDLASRSRQRAKSSVVANSAVAANSAARPKRTTETKWAKLLGERTVTAADGRVANDSSRDSVSDVRIAPLIATHWAQSGMHNWGAEYEDPPCYNYYTPDNAPCGCVATVGAQIMRYHRYPTASVTPVTNPCERWVGPGYWDYEELNLTMQGGIYEWNKMPERPDISATEEQRQAIGRLTSDIGIACFMRYDPQGSAAGSYMLADVLRSRFGYANTAVAVSFDLMEEYGARYILSSEDFRRAVISNLDAHLPMVVGMSSASYAHAAIFDGYGYSDGTLYMHINMGWAGLNDAWYAPPDFGRYDSADTIVYNIYPTGTAGCTIVSGRVLVENTGLPIEGAEVRASGASSAVVTTDAKGIWAMRLKPGAYTFTASSGGASVQRDLSVAACVSTEIQGKEFFLDPLPVIGNRTGIEFSLAVTEDPEPEPVVYSIEFRRGEGSGEMASVTSARDAVKTLPACAFTPPDGKRFAGWLREGSALRYDDGVMVFNLAEPGETVVLTALWE